MIYLASIYLYVLTFVVSFCLGIKFLNPFKRSGKTWYKQSNSLIDGHRDLIHMHAKDHAGLRRLGVERLEKMMRNVRNQRTTKHTQQSNRKIYENQKQRKKHVVLLFIYYAVTSLMFNDVYLFYRVQ